MKINLVCVGKIKEKYFTDAVSEYQKRLSRFVDFKIIELPEYPPKTQSKADISASLSAEGKKMLSEIKGYVVATAIDGEMLSSEELAALIKKSFRTATAKSLFLSAAATAPIPKF